jgi:nucleoid DNA-binding protein
MYVLEPLMSKFSHNFQSTARLIAAQSRKHEYDEIALTERQVSLVLRLLLALIFETLTRPGGKITLEGFGILEVCGKAVGGALKRGDGLAEAMQHFTYTIRFRPAQVLKDRLKKNAPRNR